VKHIMAIKYTWLVTTDAEGRKIRHRYLYHAEPASSRLLVMLPGRGYTNDMPVLYYLREVAVQLGWDVLSVTYGFHAWPETEPGDLSAEVRAVLAHVDIKQDYAHVCFAGKSMGTPIAVEFGQSYGAEKASLILLTPIMRCTSDAGDLSTLAVIGTADQVYAPDLAESTTDLPDVTWVVFDGLDHGLGFPGDWRGSLSVLPQMMGPCASFLERQGDSG
jgi:acetyl esterase/lipase